MTKEEYLERIEHLSELLGFPISEFFDLQFSPYADEYLEVLKFYEETLSNHSIYGIEPAFIYFNNFISRNAKAGLINGTYLISMNMGLIFWLIKNFRDEENIDLVQVPLFTVLKPHLDVSISKLMYQTTVHFTFYHEMSHLIQESEFLNLYLDEIPREVEEYSDEQHLLELDADEFSSLCLGSHTLQYHKKLFGEGGKPVLEALLITMCAPIIRYVLSFHANNESLYFHEKSHPHPAIRIMLITLTIVEYCNQSLVVENRDFVIDHKFVIEQALRISKQIEEEIYHENKVENLIQALRTNLNDILEYVAYFNHLKEGNTSLSVYKWNQNALNIDIEQ